MSVVFLDTETLGLDETRHDIWEVALIEEDGTEHVWHPDANLAAADPTALRLTHYYDRRDSEPWEYLPPAVVAGDVVALTAGHHIVGAVPSFDTIRLERLFRRFGFAPAWHYHLVDVEALAAGKLGIAPPWDSEKLSRKLGIEPTERHTALGDARWAKVIYETVLGLDSKP